MVKFEQLKKAHWELSIEQERGGGAAGYYIPASYAFRTEINGKKFSVLYADVHGMPTWLFGDEVKGATDDEVVEWVKNQFTNEGGFQGLYEQIFYTGMLNNF